MQQRILCVTSGLPSVLYSGVELARRLAVAGYQLTFASDLDSRELIRHHGLDFVELDPSSFEEFLDTDAEKGAIHRLLNLSDRRLRAMDSMAVGGFCRHIRQLSPDLVLINGEMHEHIIAASGADVPIALLNTFVSIWKRPGLPPPHCLARPGVGWKGSRAGIALLWRALQIRKWRTAWSLKLRRIGCDRLSILRRLARAADFDLGRETDDRQWLIPFTYRRYPVLSLHASEFEFPHDPPERVHFVGPMVLESRPDRQLAADDRARLEALLDRRRRGSGDRKLMYAGFGSAFSTDVDFLRRLFGAVAKNGHWDLVVSLGNSVAPAELGGLPDRVHAFTWVPQTKVLQSADAVVTHGGINTIDECVLAGVPMLVYCGFETDMGGTTSRVAYHGIGIAGDRRRDGPLEICSHIDRLLHEPSFRNKIRHFQCVYAAYAENRVAERTVASLLGRESHPQSPHTTGAVT